MIVLFATSARLERTNAARPGTRLRRAAGPYDGRRIEMTTAQALPREPQQDRSRITRQRLLEAAIDCLASMGWAGTTVAVVAERAGVSRGAAQHHFRTREELVTAAVEYGAEVRMAQMRERLDTLADRRPSTLDVVTLLGEMYTTPL